MSGRHGGSGMTTSRSASAAAARTQRNIISHRSCNHLMYPHTCTLYLLRASQARHGEEAEPDSATLTCASDKCRRGAEARSCGRARRFVSTVTTSRGAPTATRTSRRRRTTTRSTGRNLWLGSRRPRRSPEPARAPCRPIAGPAATDLALMPSPLVPLPVWPSAQVDGTQFATTRLTSGRIGVSTARAAQWVKRRIAGSRNVRLRVQREAVELRLHHVIEIAVHLRDQVSKDLAIVVGDSSAPQCGRQACASPGPWLRRLQGLE